MAPKELDVLARLPKTFSIYRGSFLGEVDSRLGEFSWTIDEEQAASDAVTLFGRDDICVITGMVRKAHVWAYGWGGEVMVPPEKVFKTSTRLIDAKSIDCERDKYFCFDIEGWLKEANRGS